MLTVTKKDGIDMYGQQYREYISCQINKLKFGIATDALQGYTVCDESGDKIANLTLYDTFDIKSTKKL